MQMCLLSHSWEELIAGLTGWVWESVDIPPIWDKENTESRPAADESQTQQMCLRAWQQLIPASMKADLQPIREEVEVTEGSGVQSC